MKRQLSAATAILMLVAISLVVTMAASATTVENGDFESAREGQPVG